MPFFNPSSTKVYYYNYYKYSYYQTVKAREVHSFGGFSNLYLEFLKIDLAVSVISEPSRLATLRRTFHLVKDSLLQRSKLIPSDTEQKGEKSAWFVQNTVCKNLGSHGFYGQRRDISSDVTTFGVLVNSGANV